MRDNTPTPLMRVQGLAAGYDDLRVIDGIDIEVFRGDVIAVIGHNGSGKTTLLKALFGLIPIITGSIEYFGQPQERVAPASLRSSGAVLVLQGNRVFGSMKVGDQLKFALRDRPDRAELINAIVDDFPILRKRIMSNAANLSGGERQMLALAGAFARSPQLLMLDEPTVGLSPSLAKEILESSRRRVVSVDGAAIIVEHKVSAVLEIATRVYVLTRGRVSYAGSAEDLLDEKILRKVYLGVETTR